MRGLLVQALCVTLRLSLLLQHSDGAAPPVDDDWDFADDDDDYGHDDGVDDNATQAPAQVPVSGSSPEEATGGLLSVASIVGIAVGSGVLLCLLAVSMCYRLKRRAASESPSSLPDINSEVPREVPVEIPAPSKRPRSTDGEGDDSLPVPAIQDDMLSPVAGGAGTIERGAASGRRDETEDLVTESAVRLPTTVVKQDRQMATIVWTSMMAAFITYIAYSIYEMHDIRKSPGVNIEFKRELYGLPDVALCVERGRGCVGDPFICMERGIGYDRVVTVLAHTGLVEEGETFTAADVSWEQSNPNCRLAPLSRLTLLEDSIDEDGTNSVEATIRGAWFDNPQNASDVLIATVVEVVSVYFLDVEVEGSEYYVGEVPYTSSFPTASEEISFIETTMALSSTEFNYLKGNAPKETIRKYQQTSTSYSRPRVWTEDSSDVSVAAAHLRLVIKDFSFMSVTEADPVNYATVIGAAGGAWQILCIVFGLLFVLDHKVAPQKVRRRRRKTKKRKATGAASAIGPSALQAIPGVN